MGNICCCCCCCSCCKESEHDSHDNLNMNQPSPIPQHYQSTEPMVTPSQTNRNGSSKNKIKTQSATFKKEEVSKRKKAAVSNLNQEKKSFKNITETGNVLEEEEEETVKREVKDDPLESKKKSKLSPDERILSDTEKIIIEKLKQIKSQAFPFIQEIETFTEVEDSNKYYYIDESLRRLIEKLDDMFDDLENNPFLREKRKEVYKFIFPLFDKLDDKVRENKNRLAKNNKSSI